MLGAFFGGFYGVIWRLGGGRLFVGANSDRVGV